MSDDAPKFDSSLLAVLACPMSGGPLTYAEGGNELVNEARTLAYRIDGGIPTMLPGAARRL
jgi:uncharacterized protein YbaR (Trm112 family)